MALPLEQIEEQLESSLTAYREAASFSKESKQKVLLSQVERLCLEPSGAALLYERIVDLHEAGLFENTIWQDPSKLVPGLVEGTLLAGAPTSTLELLNELRILAIAEGRMELPGYEASRARRFLLRALVAAFELAFSNSRYRAMNRYSELELNKIEGLFAFLRNRLSAEALKPYLLADIQTIIAHRPITVNRLRRMLRFIHQEIELQPEQPEDRELQSLVDALFGPSPISKSLPDVKAYEAALPSLRPEELETEARSMGEQMLRTGLVSEYQVRLLRYLQKQRKDLLPLVLALDEHGRADYSRHEAFVHLLIDNFIVAGNKQAVYGLARVLQRNLFSRKTTWNAFNRLVRIKLHPDVEARLQEGNLSGPGLKPMQGLIGGALRVLGQPLGVRQGHNPTCQSARGISMWSKHAPTKLINLLIDAASTNNVIFRYEGKYLESKDLDLGLAQQFDYKLDPVSIVLVPLLDRVYNEMMKRAPLKHIGQDPHASVNPAFYGHWIQTGFFSVYNPTLHAIQHFEQFVRVFYASFHPGYNGGHPLIYPVPIGIFITDAGGNMLGYHAISLQRIEQSPKGAWRAYFFNPNSEGKQNWGQGIQPTVAGNGERYGESSLPVHQFVARCYAYHYNQLRLGDKPAAVSSGIVTEVTKLAKGSWGQKYQWLDG